MDACAYISDLGVQRDGWPNAWMGGRLSGNGRVGG